MFNILSTKNCFLYAKKESIYRFLVLYVDLTITLYQKLITVYELFRFYIHQSYLPLVTVLITAICRKKKKTLLTLKRNVRRNFISEHGGISHATILQSIIADRDS